MLTIQYKQQSCNASFFNIPIHVPGVHYCQKYASASHQVPANQKSIHILLFRQYTHCYQHSTKGRLNYGPQSFETCIHIAYIFILILMKHSIMIQYSIAISPLIYCHIDMYRRSLPCACAVYASDLNLAIEEQSAKQLIKLQIYNLNGRYVFYITYIHLLQKHFNLAIFIYTINNITSILYHVSILNIH